MMISSFGMTYFYLTTETQYSVIDTGEAITTVVLMLYGAQFLSLAVKTGKGGPIQSIDSLKSLIPLGLNIVFRGLVPSLLQITGVLLGIIGAAIVGMSK